MKEGPRMMTEAELRELIEESARFDELSEVQQEVWRLHALAEDIEEAGGYVDPATKDAIDSLATSEEDDETILRQVSRICRELWRGLPPSVESRLPWRCLSWRSLGGYGSETAELVTE